MNPVLLKLGPFQVHWYGLLIVAGAVLAAWLSTYEAKRRGRRPGARVGPPHLVS